MTQLLDDAARRAAARPFLVEHRDGGPVALTYGEARERSRRVAAALLRLGASAERPVLIAAPNGIEHAVMTLGALRAGVPAVPISPRALGSAGDGYARLRAVVENVRPGVVFARDGVAGAAAFRAACPETPFVAVDEPPRGTCAVDYAALIDEAPLAEDVPILPETVVKIAFTSGSTGTPKGVVTTHRMLCAMQQAIAQAWPFLALRPPIVVDWLPWSHCFGGSKVFWLVLRHAGTLHVDDGDPTPPRFARSARLRTEIAPTLAFDVPLGWRAWAAQLARDEALRRRWLGKLDVACWGGAPLDRETRDALVAMGVPLAAGWGATETAPTIALSAPGDPARDALGVPVAGVELKLVPSGPGYEARVRGPQVTPGYHRSPDATRAAFDDEGFYRLGDLVRYEERVGLRFAGRCDERFKLATGTWVPVDAVRDAFLAACAEASDAVVTGDGGEIVALLVWPSPQGAALSPAELRARIAAALRRAGRNGGSATQPRRALVAGEPLASVERTGKGTPIRGAIIRNRPELVARLHAATPDAEVVVV